MGTMLPVTSRQIRKIVEWNGMGWEIEASITAKEEEWRECKLLWDICERRELRAALGKRGKGKRG